MFFILEIFGYESFGRGISGDVLNWIIQRRNITNKADDFLSSCDDQYTEYFKCVIRMLGYCIPPRDWLEARKIYTVLFLLRLCENIYYDLTR